MIRPVLRGGAAPAVGAAIAFGLGIWAGAWCLSGEVLAGALAVVCALVASRNRPSRTAAGLLMFTAAGFAAGRLRIAIPAAAAARAFGLLDRSRPQQWDGRVDGFWTRTENGSFTTVRLESLRSGADEPAFRAPARLWISGDAPIRARRGDRFRVTAAVSLPDLPASPRDFSEPFTEYSLAAKSALQISEVRRTFLSWVSLPDEALAERLFRSGLPERTVQAPIAAILLGRTAALDRGLAEEFRRGGVFHVLVISGLHVALIAGFLFFSLGAAGISRKARDAIVLAAVLGLALLVGGRIPVVRASLTIAIFLVSRLIEKPVAPLQAAGLSAIGVLALDPTDLWRAGFFVTYAAAAGIALFVPPLQRLLGRIPAPVRLPLSVALAAQVALAPLLLWRFNLVASLSWLAAPLVVPLAAFLLVCASASLLALALHLPAALPGAGVAAAVRLLGRLAGVAAKGTFLAPTPPAATLAAFAVLLLLAARGTRALRLSGIAGYVLLLAYLALRAPGVPRQCDFSVEGLDVGQGDAFLLRSGRSAFLIDGGGGFELSDEEFGRTRLMPKLLDRGVVRLEGVLLSHPHPDHALGLFSVLREMPVAAFYVGEGRDDGNLWSRLEGAARSRSVPVRTLRAGDVVPWGGGRFRILRSGGRPFKLDPINNESVVAVFEKAGRRVLFTGDAGAPAEGDLLREPGAIPRIDLLKVGHHGSRTSSTPGFLSALSPRAALLSCGRNNRFGHPAPQTLSNLAHLRIPVFRTDLRSDVGFALTRDHLFLFERGLR